MNTEGQYTTDKNLAKRIAIHGFSVSPQPWKDWYFGHVDMTPGHRILDVGCGNAFMWKGREHLVPAQSEIHLADSSPGMLDAARSGLAGIGQNWHLHIADVQELPFESDWFDLVMANHMLYHAEDIDAAIGELARVVKSNGCVLAATNGAGHMRQIREWMDDLGLKGAAGPRNGGGEQNAYRFGLENGGAQLERHFAEVQLHRHSDALAVPSARPILDYIMSMLPPDTEQTRRRLAELGDRLERMLDQSETITIEKESGLFLARQPKAAENR